MMYNICKILIEAGKTDGIKERMGTLFMVGLLTDVELTELCTMLGGQN